MAPTATRSVSSTLGTSAGVGVPVSSGTRTPSKMPLLAMRSLAFIAIIGSVPISEIGLIDTVIRCSGRSRGVIAWQPTQ